MHTSEPPSQITCKLHVTWDPLGNLLQVQTGQAIVYNNHTLRVLRSSHHVAPFPHVCHVCLRRTETWGDSGAAGGFPAPCPSVWPCFLEGRGTPPLPVTPPAQEFSFYPPPLHLERHTILLKKIPGAQRYFNPNIWLDWYISVNIHIILDTKVCITKYTICLLKSRRFSFRWVFFHIFCTSQCKLLL